MATANTAGRQVNGLDVDAPRELSRPVAIDARLVVE